MFSLSAAPETIVQVNLVITACEGLYLHIIHRTVF